jgi:catechol 2,3-dioxygenase-like lactoylglutathione lyase family enzyme
MTNTFASIRVISDDVPRLVAFYESLTGQTAQWLTPAFAAFRAPGGTLAFASIDSLTLGGTPGIAEGAANRSVFIEFRVDDVDAEHARLVSDGLVDTFELEPTTMPWGNRSILFRDPDGNLVNLFAPVTDEAKARAATSAD